MANTVFVKKGVCPACGNDGGLFRDLNRGEAGRNRLYCRPCAGQTFTREGEEARADRAAQLAAYLESGEKTEAEVEALKAQDSEQESARHWRNARAAALLHAFGMRNGGYL